jgi:hypothetical protein
MRTEDATGHTVVGEAVSRRKRFQVPNHHRYNPHARRDEGWALWRVSHLWQGADDGVYHVALREMQASQVRPPVSSVTISRPHSVWRYMQVLQVQYPAFVITQLN